MLQLADEIIDLVGSKSKILYLPLPEEGPIQRQPDISFSQKRTKWL
jgi:UDP-glucuronate decarboxylase